ncbi:MAG: hypothetical protein C6P37_04015 [Caldibacillus debilis]|jgi:hypothetical protein|uniref:Uncharacterized protein n=2 Tax=Caldibacillus debilis TaxID=301148 RepID=A0A420VJK1_9BACI|nr:hypothetical protein [Caldibacillus debilis]MBO2481182.1 hypothetical protein [Bacillaceae bacterium]KYD19382.1 hypothetical protein B4135_2040 [Caldibacillus debilis]MBY6272187.1 hypothetical protein [Bacillaceae bacterium]OUM89228.1 MAG: hypothetical protein BAA03_13705 [Caldibacillus debilis]REJ19739.1 MAG: hypothetical protein C6W57_00855 [Caldibacillus debilis]
MRKIIGLVSQVNMFVLLAAAFFLLYDLALFQLQILKDSTIGFFYTREILSLLLAVLTIKFFCKVENRYKQE